MRKTILLLIATFVCFLLSPTAAFAAIVVVDESGQIVWKVLSLESSTEEGVEIVELPSSVSKNKPSYISLARDESGNTKLLVSTSQNEKSADVTNFTSEIIEIERKDAAKRLSILAEGDYFLLKQEDLITKTQFPITINATERKLSVKTPSGVRYVGVFPAEVVSNVTKADIIDVVLEDLALTENSSGELEYNINALKNINLFNLVNVTAPLEVSVSATNGEIIEIDKPIWYKVFGFLFT